VTCEVYRSPAFIREPRGKQGKGQASTLTFIISMHLLAKASKDRGGNSCVGSVSRTEMARASFLSRLCPASYSRVGGALMFILMDLEKELGNYPERGNKALIPKSKFKNPAWPGVCPIWLSVALGSNPRYGDRRRGKFPLFIPHGYPMLQFTLYFC
jgi:hypothetical protein